MGELRRTVCGFHRVLSAVGRKRPPRNDLAITCRTARYRAQTCRRNQGPACRNSSSASPPQRTPFSLDSDRHQGDTVESGRLGRGEGGVGRPCLHPALALTPRGQACPSARGLLPFGRHHRVWEASRLRPLLTHASLPRSPSWGLCSGDSAHGIPGPAAPVAPLAPLLREAPARGPDRAVCPQVPCPRGPCLAVTLTAGQVTHHRQGQRVPQ